jgi:hypothetical protein
MFAEMLIAIIVAACAWGTPARAEELALCKMPREEANHSPLCVRYYFVCEARGVPAQGAGIYANLSFADRRRLLLQLTFALAEASCDSFDYQQALAALQAHALGLDMMTPAPPARR